MAGDYSRQTHDPRKRFASVLMQQGRVQVDADWNEQAAIALDRARRQARDTFGRAAVSRFSTVDAFRIGIVAGPPRDLSIAPGRMYVEGLLAEAFASDGTPISYLKQPFLPDPPALPGSGGANVFLDVWQREVTWVEDPTLLDVALGGVDTAARLQTVWQVRVSGVRQASCGVDLDGLFPPSPARLTTRAVAPPAPEDPCLIAPKTGYRGLENRLYRVEVHVGGATGAARFKFSRDNASVRSPVTGMRKEIRGGKEVTILTVTRIGRDPGLRISAGDWVEITDEHRFLNGESGVMAQVAEPPLEEQGADGFAVVLDRAIPPAGERAFAATADGHAERRTRIIRWDQAAPRNTIDANGLMALSGGMIELEEGVEVDFTLEGAGAQYRAGDWWVFAARTADASVEALTAAPPHGPVHHLAQLAAIGSIAANEDPSDCRTLWPPLAPQGGDGCCTAVVRPGEDIQAAIDSLPQAGGCVCLKAGQHVLRGALVIRRSRVSLHAEAPGAAVLTRSSDVPLLRIGGGDAQRVPVTDITVAGIVFQLGSIGERVEEPGLVVIGQGTERVHLSHCRFVVQDAGGMAAGVFTEGSDVTIEASIVERLAIGIRAEGATADLTVRDCAFIANPSDERGSGSLPSADDGLVAIGVTACTGALRVTGNSAVGYRFGILLGTDALGGKGLATTLALVADNVVLRGGPRGEQAAEPPPTRGPDTVTPPTRGTTAPATPAPGAATPGAATPGAATPGGLRGGLAADRAELTTDRLRLTRSTEVASLAGLSRATSDIRLANDVSAALSRLERTAGAAANVPAASETNARPGLIVAPALATVGFAIVAAAQNATVSENVLAWRGGPYGGILAARGTRLVAGNDIVATQRGEGEEAFAFGILSGLEGSLAADGVEVAGNMVSGRTFAVALNGCDLAQVEGNISVNALAAVLVNQGEGVRILGNAAIGGSVGVMAVDAAHVTIERNVVAASSAQGIVGMHLGKLPSGRVRVSGNLLHRCGFGADTAVALSYAAQEAPPGEAAVIDSTEVVIEHNTIFDTGWPETGERREAAHGIAVAAPRIIVHGNEVTWSHPARTDAGFKVLSEERLKPHRGILATPLPAQGLPPGNDEAWAGSIAITDNRVRGPSVDTLVDVRAGGAVQDRPLRFREVLVTGNVVEHWSPLDTPGAAASVSVRASEDALVSVSANVVRGSARTPSVRVEGPKQIAWAGNATSGQLIGASGQPNVVA